MDFTKPLFAVVVCGVGMLLIALAVPLIWRRVKPNPLYGVRVAATFADDWVWYEANARSGRYLAAWGAVQIVIALVLLIMPGISGLAYALINAAIIGIGTIVYAAASVVCANRLLKERQGSGHNQH